MLDKSFIPDIDFGKNCIHCIAVNFCTVYHFPYQEALYISARIKDFFFSMYVGDLINGCFGGRGCL